MASTLLTKIELVKAKLRFFVITTKCLYSFQETDISKTPTVCLLLKPIKAEFNNKEKVTKYSKENSTIGGVIKEYMNIPCTNLKEKRIVQFCKNVPHDSIIKYIQSVIDTVPYENQINKIQKVKFLIFL